MLKLEDDPLEILVEVSREDEVIHLFCGRCYPVDDQEIAYCGLDLSQERAVAFWTAAQECVMCLEVLDTFVVEDGRRYCPNGHRVGRGGLI